MSLAGWSLQTGCLPNRHIWLQAWNHHGLHQRRESPAPKTSCFGLSSWAVPVYHSSHLDSRCKHFQCTQGAECLHAPKSSLLEQSPSATEGMLLQQLSGPRLCVLENFSLYFSFFFFYIDWNWNTKINQFDCFILILRSFNHPEPRGK